MPEEGWGSPGVSARDDGDDGEGTAWADVKVTAHTISTRTPRPLTHDTHSSRTRCRSHSRATPTKPLAARPRAGL